MAIANYISQLLTLAADTDQQLGTSRLLSDKLNELVLCGITLMPTEVPPTVGKTWYKIIKYLNKRGLGVIGSKVVDEQSDVYRVTNLDKLGEDVLLG